MRYPAVIAPLALWVMFIITSPNSLKLSSIGLLDTVSIAALLSALVVIPLIISRSLIAHILSAFLILSILSFNAGATLYSYTYNSYPTLDFSSVMGNSIHIFSSVYFLTAGLLIIIITIAASKLINHFFVKISRSKLIISALVFSVTFIAGQDGYKNFYNSNPISTLTDTNAAGFLFRSAIPLPIWVQDIETMKYHERMASLTHFKEFNELPEKYHAKNLKEFTGNHSKSYTTPFPKTYPLYQSAIEPTTHTPKENIIIILLESVRASEMGIYGAKNSASPFMDSLAKQSNVFLNAYSTAPITGKSEFVINCSTLDFFAAASASSQDNLQNKRCIASILKESGFNTYWFHGNEKEIYNRGTFFPKIGYQNIIAEYELNQLNVTDKLAWGISDTALFDHVLKTLEKEDKPFLAEVLTLSNHLPFNYDWKIKFPDYLTKQNNKGDYLNDYRKGIYYTDQALKQFFTAFWQSDLSSNTHVIITGDHGVWAFDQSNTYSQLSKDEHFFRIPLMIWSPNRHKEIHTALSSHLDIAPTILDILDITTDNSFIGRSLYSDEEVLNNRLIYTMYHRNFGYRSASEACAPINGCIDFFNTPKCSNWATALPQNPKKENKLDMICSPISKVQNFNHKVFPTHFRSSADDHRILLDYSQIGLQYKLEPDSTIRSITQSEI
jgi:phosphoglycerol transferase MdoB-like AlkP superfamily enzyme